MSQIEERQNQLLLVLLCVGNVETLWLWPWKSYQGTLHINSIRIQTSTPDWRWSGWGEALVYVCACVNKISPILPPKSTKGWGMTSWPQHNNRILLAVDVWLFSFRLLAVSAETQVSSLGFSATWSHFGGGNKTNLQINHLAQSLHCWLCVCWLHVGIWKCAAAGDADRDVTRTSVGHFIGSHYAGFAWTLTPNCLSNMHTHTQTHGALHLKHTYKNTKALRDKYTCRCAQTHTRTRTHPHRHFICLNILTNMPPQCLTSPPVPQMLCPAAPQQHLIALLHAAYTVHALVELIEVSPAHHCEMGAMCCV